MTREWKIGDWAELRSVRYLVFRVVKNGTAWAIPECGGFNEIMFDANDKEVKKLDGCDSWDWQPPKPIEPPQGYRLLTEGEKVMLGDYTYNPNSSVWMALHKDSLCIGKPHDPQEFWSMARKIEPKVRPMTRAEFLAAWKQRGFCPLIDDEQDIDVVLTVTEETEFDLDCVNLNEAGWCSMDELADYKFASDETHLTIEE